VFVAPTRRGQFGPQQLGGIVLDENPGFEIQAGVQPEHFVSRPGIAVGAAVLAAAVGIDAVAERDVGAVVFGDQPPGFIGQKNRRHPSRLVALVRLVELLQVSVDAHPLETVGRIDPGGASNGSLMWGLLVHLEREAL
jgi:hypothetical protein